MPTGMASGMPRMAEVMSAAPAPMPAKTQQSPPQQSLSIKLQKFQPNAPYAKRLQEASREERYAIYLDERPNYLSSTAFYLDVADIFFEKGETDLAVRILSNLAEMNLENRHILRILAYRLWQANLTDLALPLLKKVQELSPNEPQSYRDLGLLEAQAGKYQSAVDDLWEVASRPWESRFSDIDIIALGELNAVAALHSEVNLSRVDDRLIKNLPLDLRAVLSWDADNTDIDLWVIDPNKEKVYYAHTLSYQGGRISRDFTAGYGPEEFSLKSAKPGKYEIRAYFYGHRQQVVSPYTTLMLKLSTGFGTPNQKDENIILRLSGQGEEVFVGSFVVGEK
jgi:Ca-activated chloride channel homolog